MIYYIFLHDPVHAAFQLLHGFTRQYFQFRKKIHIELYGKQEESFIGWIGPAAVEDNHRNDGFPAADGEAEGAIVKGFERFGRSIAGSLRINAHMQSHVQHFMHFSKTFPAAFFV